VRAVLLALACAALGVLLPACDDPRRKEFDAAGDRGDWPTVLAMIDDRSWPHLEQVLQRARTATRTDLDQLSLGDRYEVIIARHLLTPEQLRTSSAQDYVRASVEAGCWNTSEEDDNAFYGRARVHGDYATVELLDMKGKPTGDFDYWYLSNKVWKIDLSRGRAVTTIWLEQLWHEYHIAPNDLMVMILEQNTGREVSPEIWAPKGQ
jgi:hypothetical protein